MRVHSYFFVSIVLDVDHAPEAPGTAISATIDGARCACADEVRDSTLQSGILWIPQLFAVR